MLCSALAMAVLTSLNHNKGKEIRQGSLCVGIMRFKGIQVKVL